MENNNTKNKSKTYVRLIDKELDYFRTNITRIKELEPTSYSNDVLYDTNSNFITNDKNYNEQSNGLNSNQEVKNKKPVVTINSFPKVDPLPPKKPVVIIKKNISNLENKQKPIVVKKPVVSIIPQKELLKSKELQNNPTDYKTDISIDFDAPPTKEQIDHSSVYIIPKEKNNSFWNKQVDNQIEKLNEKPFLLFTNDKSDTSESTNEKEHKKDYFSTKPISSVFIKGLDSKQDDNNENDYNDYQLQEPNVVFEEYESDYQPVVKEIDHNLIPEAQEVDYNDVDLSNNLDVEDYSSNILDNLGKSTKITLNIKDYEFESLILDSIEKYIYTSVFKAKILKKLNMSIYANDVVLVYCPTSGGKTTLLNIIARKENFNKGEYLIHDFKHKELNEAQINDFISQHLFYIHRAISLSSQETVYWHLKNAYNKYCKECNYTFALDDIINKFNIGGCVNRTFNILNNIEKTIVLIVYSIITNNKIILVDDPYLPDDIQEDYLFKNVIRTANTVYNKTIVITAKDKRLYDIATKIYSLSRGSAKLITNN